MALPVRLVLKRALRKRIPTALALLALLARPVVAGILERARALAPARLVAPLLALAVLVAL